MTDYQIKLLNYVMQNTAKTKRQAVIWLNKFCPSWKKPNFEMEFQKWLYLNVVSVDAKKIQRYAIFICLRLNGKRYCVVSVIH